MSLTVPKEPRLLSFDPAQNFLAPIFEDEITRSIWLLISSLHIVDDRKTPKWCRYLAARIRESPPKLPVDLFELIRKANSMQGPGPAYVTESLQECELFVIRMFDAVTGRRPVEYKLLLPGTPEREEYDRNRA